MPEAISPDLERFVQSEIASGRYQSREAVVAEGLRLLQRDREEAIEGIRLGLADVADGRVQALADAFKDLRSELHVSKDA
jgi:putative addiction module CopG family antidote